MDLRLGRVTTLVGPSDVGKSAVVRALYHACFNKPAGVGHLRHGATSYEVRLASESGTVLRGRGRGGNVYRLGKAVFKSFGVGVPAPVSGALNLSRDNFQLQHDAPYWLSLSPPQAGKELNKVVNLQLIDRVLANAGRRVRRAKERAEWTRERLQEARQSRDSLAWVTDCRRDWKALDGRRRRLERLKTQAQELQDTLDRIKQAAQVMHKEGMKAADLDGVVAAAKRLLMLTQNREDLEVRLLTLRRNNEEIELGLHELEQVREELIAIERCPTCGQPLLGDK